MPGTILGISPIFTHLHFTKTRWANFLAPWKRWRNWNTDSLSNSSQGTQLVNGRVTGHLAPGCLFLMPLHCTSASLSGRVQSQQRAQGLDALSSRISRLLIFLLWVWYPHLYPFLAWKIMVRHVFFIMLLSNSNKKFLFNVFSKKLTTSIQQQVMKIMEKMILIKIRTCKASLKEWKYLTFTWIWDGRPDRGLNILCRLTN